MKLRLWMVAAALGTLFGQDAQPDRLTVPFGDASKPRSLEVHLVNGSVKVTGYDGKDAIIEASSLGRLRRPDRRPPNVPEGMHRIDTGASGLEVEEDNNAVKVTGGISGAENISVQVPVETSLNLKTVNGGNIVVENISGEIDVNNVNGGITVTNASGSVLANSQNGKVTVSLDKVTPAKAMSFSAFNGGVDVTFPADIKANLKMRTNNGEIWSDFDIKLDSSSHPPVVEDNRGNRGRYRVRLDRAVYGTINGGGPEIQFTTFNGNIVIHKK
jgi:DUF4097 and DUF4098 domain-containing protein YvlB